MFYSIFLKIKKQIYKKLDMKKTIFSLMFAMMVGMALCSCGNGKAEATDVDSVAVDSVEVVDTTVVDSVAADTVADVVVAE